MSESRTRVVGWIDKDALHLACELLLQRLKREQVVAEDQPVVEDVVLRHALLRVIALLRVLQQDARLQLRPVLLANPRQFQFLLFVVHYCPTLSLLDCLLPGFDCGD